MSPTFGGFFCDDGVTGVTVAAAVVFTTTPFLGAGTVATAAVSGLVAFLVFFALLFVSMGLGGSAGALRFRNSTIPSTTIMGGRRGKLGGRILLEIDKMDQCSFRDV